MSLNWIGVEDYEAMCREGALRIVTALEQGLRQERPVLLGLATGNTMLTLYQRLAEMINERRLNLEQLHTFNLDEYVGADGQWVPEDHPVSYRAYMQANLFRRIEPERGLRPENIHFPDPVHPKRSIG